MKISLTEAQKRQIDWRSETSFLHAQEVYLAWGTLDPVIDWCRAECRGDWRWQIIDTSSDTRPGRYIFYFDSGEDCCAFTLKWA